MKRWSEISFLPVIYSALLLTGDFCTDHIRLSNIGISLAEKIEEIGIFLLLPHSLENI